ncbi:uncharacterized protein FOMMEDRAFT_25068 [Fomitiporia mediterranea MF3/22]|uniref:uncharacterized protein n=1 Tax=Fomitiporia mediterranea (strain MF3/22) TaxID=694068 RepID=UPI0004409A4B|nr:uncharacterized protein FOMMEDRAFT_25068 [Fomitiporia mediterranea MF3/22]EJD07790.1 hypothetical protein FOMMEDRAFT_25068 [Fomitiporia mediterranea MF3/22]
MRMYGQLASLVLWLFVAPCLSLLASTPSIVSDCDHQDVLCRNALISQSLASRVTLYWFFPDGTAAAVTRSHGGPDLSYPLFPLSPVHRTLTSLQQEMSKSSTSKSQRTDVRVAPTTYDDLPGIATCEMLAFSGAFPPHEPLNSLLFPFRAPLARSGVHPRHWPDFASSVNDHIPSLYDGSIMFTAFAPDENGRDNIAGFVKMTPPKEMLEEIRRKRKLRDCFMGDVVYPAMDTIKNKLWKDTSGLDIVLWRIFKQQLKDARARINKEGRFFLLNLLIVHPSFQGRGVGSALLKQCFTITDAANRPVFLESTTAGYPLYVARGFVEIDRLDWTYAGPNVDKTAPDRAADSFRLADSDEEGRTRHDREDGGAFVEVGEGTVV